MKKARKYTLLIVGLASISTFILSEQNIKSYRQLVLSGIEALSSGEGSITVYCRCHEDNNCYSGNFVSFRGFCTSGLVPDSPAYYNCRQHDNLCK